MNFGNRIKKLRNEKKWTQEFVAEKLNISVGALSRYETGMYEPKSLDLIKDFSILFGVSTDYLLGKTDIRKPEEQIKDEFLFAYHKETEGLSEDEILDAIKAYKEIKNKIQKNNGEKK